MGTYINKREAIAEVDDLLKRNTEFLHSMQDFSKTARKVGAGSKPAELKKKSYTGLTTKELQKVSGIIREYGKNVNISKFFEERITLAHDFDIAVKDYVRDPELYKERTFADLVKSGPKNQHEEVILMSATAFLEPHEMKAAVHSGASIKEVCKQIDLSLIKRMSNQILNKIGVEEVENYYEQPKDFGLDILSRRFGILDAIMEAVNNIGQDAQKQEASQKLTKRERSQ